MNTLLFVGIVTGFLVPALIAYFAGRDHGYSVGYAEGIRAPRVNLRKLEADIYGDVPACPPEMTFGRPS